MVADWKEKDEVVLINALESRPTLWKLTDPMYRITHVKDQLWDEVANEIDNPSVNGGEARRKWSVLRDSFSKIHRKVERSKSGVLGSNFVYRPKWKWYQAMTFLLNNPQPKSDCSYGHENDLMMLQIGNNEETQSDEEREGPLSPSDDNSLIDLWERPSTSTNASAGREETTNNDSSSCYTNKKSTKRKLESEPLDVTKENSPMATKLLALLAKQNCSPPNDRAEHVGQLVAIQLRTLDKEEQTKKILEIMELLYKN
ncbi:Alcohol dehydrogenase transcription factor Myb/SANT-like [Nesidiocoris tenuis]|uniref:Alcohol dehydrogenase transcription factor Myb/SANT-like n=1 Tax=Nesidiocoris tenuis TaxID=355587 RepID=A0ABN7ASZ3_9HEMI|nr:Alcohol dehydrogenase transcription factor Myb/SANT-like [Nesidiocoris tenuis]